MVSRTAGAAAHIARLQLRVGHTLLASPTACLPTTRLVHVLQLLLNNLIFGIIYSLNWRFFEQYKISSMPWPWRSEKASVRADFWAAVWRAVGRVVINNVFIALPLAFVGYSYNKASGAFSTSLEDWPSTWTIVWQIAVRDGWRDGTTAVVAAVALAHACTQRHGATAGTIDAHCANVAAS